MSNKPFQIRLIAWFIVVLSWSCVLAIIPYRRISLSNQRRVVKQLEQFGVEAEWNSDGVWSISFKPDENQRRLQDKDVGLLTDLPHLWALDLRHTAITDAGVGELAASDSILFLILPKTSVSETKIDELQAQLPKASIGRR